MSNFTARAITNWCPECGKAYTHDCGVEGVWFTPDSLTTAVTAAWATVLATTDTDMDPSRTFAAAIIKAAKEAERRRYYGLGTDCHADRDGDCDWSECPQTRDGEPAKTGRHCPLDVGGDGA